ncbi:MAG: hypothetical protein IJ268_03725, partial [Proteobacteria bacterium]|nr:hypothetical protein [Pseudomonadota bacterium]
MRSLFNYSAAIVTAFSLTTMSSSAFAVNVEQETADITVVIESDGTAHVTDKILINVSNGPLTAMFVENMALTPNWGKAVADVVGKKQRIPLKINQTASGKHYELEADPKIPNGKTYMIFTYSGNMIEEGYIGKTTSDEHGDLYYFHWAPMQWETAMKYRDVKIVLPVEVPSEQIPDNVFVQIAGYSRNDTEASDSNAKILTHRSLNERNKIDYIGTKIGDKYLLTMHVFQKDVDPKEAQNILFYMRPDFVAFDNSSAMRSLSTSELSSDPDAPNKTVSWLILLMTFGLGASAIVAGKRRRKQADEAPRETLISDELWEAPELQVGSFGQKGKVAKDLHPIEVGLLLGLELSQIIGIMTQALGDQNKLIVRSLEPITAFIQPDAALEPIEHDFVEIFNEIGNIDEQKLQEFIEKVIAGLQEKTWDCDLEATRKYYLAVMYHNPDEPQKDKLEFKVVEDKYYADPYAARPSDLYDDYYWRNRYYWRHYNGYYRDQYHYNHGLSNRFAGGYTEFLRSSACFHGCFEQPNLESVCHSACHSA